MLKACLRGNAKTEFASVTLNGIDDTARVIELKEWLRTTYHIEEVKQGLRDQLNDLRQRQEETPRAFFTRISQLINLAEYPEALREPIAEGVFMKGISDKMAIAIKSSPMPLDIAGKVNYAQRMWTARNPTQSLAFKPLLTQERPVSIMKRPEISSMKAESSKITEDPIEALTKQMEEMKLFMANI
jgi:hypothetical protein